MVENNTFMAKCPILIIFRKCHKWGTKHCIDLNSASIYSSYYYSDTVKFIWDPPPKKKINKNQKLKKKKTLYFEKTRPLSAGSLIQGNSTDYNYDKIRHFQNWGCFSSGDLVIRAEEKVWLWICGFLVNLDFFFLSGNMKWK